MKSLNNNKFYIGYNLTKQPYGGANQFLSSLKKEFDRKNISTNEPKQAQALLYNSHSLGKDSGDFFVHVIRQRLKFPEKAFIHRIDGPVSFYQGTNIEVDNFIYEINNLIFDGTVFQSMWSKKQNQYLGKKKSRFETVILNAPNPKLFNNKNKSTFSANRKIKVVAVSWARNSNKGFEDYKWLDENLNFDKFEVTFVGNTPVKFKNITHIKPLNSQKLADYLKKQDIYLTASRKDPCSNALIEALHCGLPALAYNDGGHPEIIGEGGSVYNHVNEVPGRLDKIINNYSKYRNAIKLPDIHEVGTKYEEFMNVVFSSKKNTSKSLDEYSRLVNLIIKRYKWKITKLLF